MPLGPGRLWVAGFQRIGFAGKQHGIVDGLDDHFPSLGSGSEEKPWLFFRRILFYRDPPGGERPSEVSADGGCEREANP